MQTRLTQLLGIRYPIIQGALQWLARAPLAGAVSAAGGLGIINAKSFTEPEDLRAEIAAVRAITDRPFAVNISMLPELAGPDPVQQWVEVCLSERVPVVETAGRSPKEFLPALKQAGIKVIHKVPAVRFGLSAQRAGVDAVTLVGFECGGHPGMDGVGSLVLIPRGADQLSVPLIAGGGVADGRGLAAALALGADGVVMGTRFLLAQEVELHPAIRRRLLAADELATTLVMGSLRNNARVLNNAAARECLELEAKGAGIEELRGVIGGGRGLGALRRGDPEDGILALGQGVGLIEEILPAAQIIERTIAQARESLARMQQALA
ncbi:MAG: nitronate monooxygenase [Desulfarculus sp.]|nr:MAG: nitronate monooxygenase [Desulfarculus sp.]